MRQLSILICIICLALAGCDTPDVSDSSGGEATAAAHDLEFPDGVESEVPFPPDATIRTVAHPEEDAVSVVFDPEMEVAEAVDFFSDKLSSGGWTLTDEDVAELDVGVRSTWRAEGHGMSLYINGNVFTDEHPMPSMLTTIVQPLD